MMIRAFGIFILGALIITAAGCSGSGGSVGSGGGGTQSNAPSLTSIVPSSAVAGASSLTIEAYGSGFQVGAAINWNGTELPTNCVDINLLPVNCPVAVMLTAAVPASDFATAGTAKVTLSNLNDWGAEVGTSNPVNFTIAPPPAGTTWARTVAGISAPNDIAWDAAHGKLYVSVSSVDTANANTIAVIDPVAGNAASFVPAGNNPNLLSISSDSGYLWAGIDGGNTVQRFLLPGLTKDISFPLPLDWQNNPQQAVSLQAAPVSAHTLALIAGHSSGDGVYVYDDAIPRPISVPCSEPCGGPMIDWMQWGADDTTIYGNQYSTIDAGGIATMTVNSSGVSLKSYGGGLLIQPRITHYDRNNGLLYSDGSAYDPANPSLMGTFDLADSSGEACTADSGLGRYYCVMEYSVDSTDVTFFELRVFDLNSYALVSRAFFGATAAATPPSVSGHPWRLVRWGNAGLAVLGQTRPSEGNGGIFLIDGAAVNPSATPDTTSGTANSSYAWLNTIAPDVATTTSGEVQVTIKGQGFSPDSTACWNCNYLIARFLPTTYVSATQLKVTIPLANVSSTLPLEISVYDQGSNLFSSNALTFTVLPASGTTQVTPVNLCGLAMAWDAKSQLLYVATADYDNTSPNSIVAVNPSNGALVKTQSVGSDPSLLSDSSDGSYLYVGYAGSTNMTRIALPSLGSPVTWALNPSSQGPYYANDLKAAPVSPDTTAVSYFDSWGLDPGPINLLGIYDGSTLRPTLGNGPSQATTYDSIAWSNSDSNLAATGGGFSLVQVTASGATLTGTGSATMTPGELHSDFGTGLIYSDNGNVANPGTGALVGSYQASGLVAPDSSLNRVYILGQTAAQANTNSYTIQSFDQKAFKLVSSITLNNVSGGPIALTRWGSSGLAVLTAGGLAGIVENGNGMLYLLQDSSFVSSNAATTSVREAAPERVQQRWNRRTIRETLFGVHQAQRDRAIAPN